MIYQTPAPNVCRLLRQITQQKLSFVRGDIRDADVLQTLFAENKIQAVLHFAGLKAVGESVTDPIHYYDVNLNGTLKLVEAMAQADGRAGVN